MLSRTREHSWKCAQSRWMLSLSVTGSLLFGIICILFDLIYFLVSIGFARTFPTETNKK